MTKECKQQFTLRITQANPTQLIVILYEMLLCYLEEGEAAQDREELREAVRKARGCVNELIQSLHLEYEPAPTLMQLYLFCIKRLAACEARGDMQAIADIKKVIQPLRDAYAQIEQLNDRGPVMNNSQTIYAGLTYGKNTLTENMTDQGSNRGMLV
ncbi:MAG: flagellar protein FliS [Lachnospiraceae bacterium]|nr:flagellar protein FliS [Lachnospiraceae bacterium]